MLNTRAKYQTHGAFNEKKKPQKDARNRKSFSTAPFFRLENLLRFHHRKQKIKSNVLKRTDQLHA